MKPASVMVWAAVFKSWRSPLIFVEEMVKINARVYIEKILTPMLESADDHFGDDTLWTFQQDGANTTQQISPRTGAVTIFHNSGRKRNGLHAPQTSTRWTSPYGQFLRPITALKFTILLKI